MDDDVDDDGVIEEDGPGPLDGQDEQNAAAQQVCSNQQN